MKDFNASAADCKFNEVVSDGRLIVLIGDSRNLTDGWVALPFHLPTPTPFPPSFGYSFPCPNAAPLRFEAAAASHQFRRPWTGTVPTVVPVSPTLQSNETVIFHFLSLSLITLLSRPSRAFAFVVGRTLYCCEMHASNSNCQRFATANNYEEMADHTRRMHFRCNAREGKRKFRCQKVLLLREAAAVQLCKFL